MRACYYTSVLCPVCPVHVTLPSLQTAIVCSMIELGVGQALIEMEHFEAAH
jgi:hypothetical protein